MSFPKRERDALNYNERKVHKGVARCLGASGYLREAGSMNFYQKLQGLEHRNALNSRATTKTLHVSLNFHPSERLQDETLLQIAAGYMERIGFGAQPYLVYRHYDAGHPHLHIVSTTIRDDGSRIATHNLGRFASQNARRELEVLFGLMQAEEQKKTPGSLRKPERPAVVHYGKVETKGSIARVVHWVFNHYAFSSLAQYNAALRPFNVLADEGREGGRMHQHRGLIYHVLNDRGGKVGVPIKASSLPGSPTLGRLQLQYVAGEKKKGLHKSILNEKLDRCFGATPSSLELLMAELSKKDVFTLSRCNGDGRLYGITFVDHETRCVFDGSDLGRAYSAEGIQVRLAAAVPVRLQGERRVDAKTVAPGMGPQSLTRKEDPHIPSTATLLDLLLASNRASENLTAPLLPKKRRKKKRRPSP